MERFNPFNCDECGELISSNSRLIQHILSHRGTTVFCCEECEEVFLSESQLDQHTATLHTKAKTYECETCGKFFSHHRTLMEHVITHYEKPEFKCSHCKKEFYTKKSMTQHAKVHARRNFACEECGGKFKWKGDLMRHLRNIHSSEYRHKCRKCGTGFYHRDLLSEHKKIAHGEGRSTNL